MQEVSSMTTTYPFKTLLYVSFLTVIVVSLSNTIFCWLFLSTGVTGMYYFPPITIGDLGLYNFPPKVTGVNSGLLIGTETLVHGM